MTELAAHPLTHVRQENGWSMADLARLVRRAAGREQLRSGVDRNRVWRWETGRATPSPGSQHLLARILDVPPGQVDTLGWPHWLPAHVEPHPFTLPGSRAAVQEVVVARMDRRAFLVLGGGALAGMARDWAVTEPGRLTGALDGRAVDPELVTWLENRTAELRTLAATSEPLVANLVDAHLSTAIRLLDQARYSEAVGLRLCSTVATLAQCAGWQRFDQSRHGGAQRYWQAALHASHLAGDRELGAGVLADLAYQATWLGQPRHAVDILGWARSRTASPAARSLLDVRRARALAQQGDAVACEKALSSAERELDRARPETTPGWVGWMSAADLASDAGRCWLDLGRPGRASSSIEAGLRLLDPGRARTRAVFLSYRAESAFAVGDVEAARVFALDATGVAAGTGAARCVRQAATVADRVGLGRWMQGAGSP
ncbi:helix-turn-helix transcriptional regulator [Longispora sp. K20-0274]|uniref:helix-turn-helix transcriptional regulator n=1 Tax=Longispora sp. K20-0274 TaxID=3088255 RepID=UPI00399BF267